MWRRIDLLNLRLIILSRVPLNALLTKFCAVVLSHIADLKNVKLTPLRLRLTEPVCRSDEDEVVDPKAEVLHLYSEPHRFHFADRGEVFDQVCEAAP